MREDQRLEALWFGRERARCFGMLHQPQDSSTRGVIFCNALGYDGLVAYRALRELANDASERGLWALRFDYDGDNDSAGGPWETDRFGAWIGSIDAAVNVLRSRGVTDIRLVGFRAGASLAQQYATTHAGISGVALWWPCVSGSAYVRELRALSRLSNAARPAQHIKPDRFPEDSLEVSGFEFGAQALTDLTAMDLVAAVSPVPVPSVLLIDRQDAPPSDLLIRKLVDAGSKVDHEQMAGYAEFMIDEGHRSIVPSAILRRISDWLDAPGPEAPELDLPIAFAPAESTTLTIDDPTACRFTPPGPAVSDVVEEQVWIGKRLFAIMANPAGGQPKRDAAIVLCTAGWNSRIGPGRMHVDLARYWASLGYTVLRVDLGGVGESVATAPASENHIHSPIRIAELSETVDWVRDHTGCDDVVLFGLCSGAFNAFHAAIEGVDMNHVILVNPGIFYLGADQTAEMSAESRLAAAHALSRGLFTPRKWRLVFKEQSFSTGVRRVRVLVREGATDGVRHAAGAVARNAARRVGFKVNSPSPLPRDLEAITQRGVKVVMVFSAGESTAHYVRVFAGPAIEPLLEGDGVKIIDIDGGDHVFSPPGARQRLFEETTNYLERAYAVRAIPDPAIVSDRGATSANDA